MKLDRREFSCSGSFTAVFGAADPERRAESAKVKSGGGYRFVKARRFDQASSAGRRKFEKALTCDDTSRSLCRVPRLALAGSSRRTIVTTMLPIQDQLWPLPRAISGNSVLWRRYRVVVGLYTFVLLLAAGRPIDDDLNVGQVP